MEQYHYSYSWFFSLSLPLSLHLSLHLAFGKSEHPLADDVFLNLRRTSRNGG
jgi:hypothetical protein